MTEEQRRFESIKAQLGIPNHTTYAGPRPTYINLHSDLPKLEPVRATREHSTPPHYQIPVGWVQAILAISSLPVRGCRFTGWNSRGIKLTRVCG
jgi:hypothetical protein